MKRWLLAALLVLGCLDEGPVDLEACQQEHERPPSSDASVCDGLTE